jgi:hypothetical protein
MRVTPNSVNDELSVPLQFGLNTPYPNPFNASTTFRFTLPNEGNAQLAIYDLSGRMLTRLVEGKLAAGEHTVHWSAEASGVYFAALSFGQQKIVKKLVCVR